MQHAITKCVILEHPSARHNAPNDPDPVPIMALLLQQQLLLLLKRQLLQPALLLLHLQPPALVGMFARLQQQ